MLRTQLGVNVDYVSRALAIATRTIIAAILYVTGYSQGVFLRHPATTRTARFPCAGKATAFR